MIPAYAIAAGFGLASQAAISAIASRSSPGVASFALAAQGEHEDRVDFREVAVQGDIAAGTASDHQLSLFSMNGPADQGILLEHGDRLNNFPNARGRIVDVVLGEMIEDAVDVTPDLGSQFDPRHLQRASFLAVGRVAALPASWSSR